jgi:prevent-host-death family protein
MKTSFSEDVTPVTDFRTKSAALIERMKRTRRPLILTHRGRTTAVLEDIREYERRLERLEFLEAIVAGLQAAEKGDLLSHEAVMRRMDDLLNE